MVAPGSTSALMDEQSELLTIDDPVFIGRPIDELSALIVEQSAMIFEEQDIVIPVRSCSLMTALGHLKEASASDLASTLDQSHQLILQKLPKLLRLDLVERNPDPEDARRKVFSLTEKGKEQLALFQDCSVQLRKAYKELFEEVGDIKRLATVTIAALRERTLSSRVGVIQPGT